MRKELFAELLESVKEMQDIRRGRRRASRVTRVADLRRAEVPEVSVLRARFQLSQSKFAALLGISVDTLQNWEQGRRQPEGPARVLLRIAASYPEALLELSKPPRKRRNGRSAA